MTDFVRFDFAHGNGSACVLPGGNVVSAAETRLVTSLVGRGRRGRFKPRDRRNSGLGGAGSAQTSVASWADGYRLRAALGWWRPGWGVG